MPEVTRTPLRRAACWLAGVVVLAALPAAVQAQVSASAPRLGQPLAIDTLPPSDRAVLPDGQGLPPGRGTVADGARLYRAMCAACHGAQGEGGATAGRLVGRSPLTGVPRAEKTVGNTWPWATTLFAYIHRAMPWHAPGSLSADEAYALTAWLLHANGIVGADAVIDAGTLPAVRMPNRDGFVAAPP
jgi:cytochrome c